MLLRAITAGPKARVVQCAQKQNDCGICNRGVVMDQLAPNIRDAIMRLIKAFVPWMAKHVEFYGSPFPADNEELDAIIIEIRYKPKGK